MSTFAFLEGLGAYLVLILLFILQRRVSERRSAEAWLNYYFAQIRDDRASRDRLGRFLAKHNRPSNEQHQ